MNLYNPATDTKASTKDGSKTKVQIEWEHLVQSPNSLDDEAIKEHYGVSFENTDLNRYCDILALEKTRVHLEDNGYINANYIDLEQLDYRCIATQAPLPNTFVSFWNMVWENNSRVVVMLTKLREQRKVKAHGYWPEDSGVIGDITITLDRSEKVSEGVLVKHFLISKNNETKKVLHVQHTSWPDRGVPSSTEEIRKVYHTIRPVLEEHPKKGCPLIVHCSAGVGRAGTFLSFIAFCEAMRRNNMDFESVKVPDIVSALRSQRMAMVQSIEQYTFIYQMIFDEFQPSKEQHGVEINKSYENLREKLQKSVTLC